jgi:ABC-type transporter Mla MlaB component
VDFEAEPVGPRTEADVGDAASLHLRLLTPSPVELAILHGLAAWRLDREPVGAVVRLMGPLDGGAALEDLRPVERRVRVIDFAAVERVTAAGLARLLAWLPPAGRGPPVRLRAVPAAVAEWLAGTGERGRYEVETPAAPPRRP